MRFFFTLLLAAFSGCAALSHELLWTRRLIDLLGASAVSSTLVFECFFLGLALGAACSMGPARRARRPWITVGVIEVGIAVLSVPALTLAAWSGWIWPWLGPEELVSSTGTAVKLGLAVAVMLPPTFLMGMTLPLMGRAILDGGRTLERHGIWLYAVNTLGGVTGLVLTTMVTLPALGVGGSMVVAAGINLVVAAACVAMDRCSEGVAEGGRGNREMPEVSPGAVDPRGSDRFKGMMLVVSFASGAGVLGMEILGMHLLLQVVPSALHAVAALLAAIILLLAVAAFVVPVLVSRWRDVTTLFAPTMMLTGVAVAASPLLFMWLTGGMRTIRPSGSLLGFSLKMTGYVVGIFGPCLLFAGLIFPLVFAWLSGDGGDPRGRRWGWLLAVNGVGGVIGAEVAQRVLMPVVGMHGALGMIGMGYVFLGAILILYEQGWSALRGPLWRAVGVMVLIAGLGYGWLLRFPLIHPAPTKEIQFTTLDLAAGPEGIVAVTESEAMGRGIVMFNQYVLGSSAGTPDEQRQAHLSLVLHPDPRRVAFIGLATGITAGAALMHDEVEAVTPIELSRFVADACRDFFGEYTNDLFSDPRVDVVVEDGRTYLAACVDRFDVIAGDLFLPWRPGVGRLYSVEHFRAVRRALTDGGLFCQMLPMYQFSRRQQEVVLATFLEVFPEADLFRVGFRTANPMLAIVGFKGGRLDWGSVGDRCRRVREQNRVRDLLIRHREGIAMLYLGRVSADDAPGAPINTLSNAWIELSAGRDYVTGAWQDNYFMNHERWLAFEDRMAERMVDPAEEVGVAIGELSKLGGMICRWSHLISKRDLGAADGLAQEVRELLPVTLQSDAGADRSMWKGWDRLLGR